MHLWREASLVSSIYDAMHLWCAESLVHCILVAIFFCCTASLVHRIFCVYVYMNFWYLWWCLVGGDYYCAMHHWRIVSWPWVQYIFGVASLVLCIVSYIVQACYRSVASTL